MPITASHAEPPSAVEFDFEIEELEAILALTPSIPIPPPWR
jgi:hypothetical protein